MNEQLLKARAAFEEAQTAFDTEPDTENALDKLMDVVHILLSRAEAEDNVQPEIADLPPPPVEAEQQGMPVPEADTGAPAPVWQTPQEELRQEVLRQEALRRAYF